MILIKTDDEINILRESSLLVGKTLAEVARFIKPGVTTLELDKIAEDYILSQNAKPGFKGYQGFPATLCISVNDVVVHGIPNEYALKDGDIVSIDCGVIHKGYYGDSAFTFAVGNISDEKRELMKCTRESLYKGIEMAIAGKRVGDIGFAVQSYVESFGYSVVRDLVGHGLGKSLHEEPQVPNYGRRGIGPLLKENMVICIEPMINMGTRRVTQDPDGWTIRTADRLPSAHYEHAVVVNKGKADILSSFEYIEEVFK